MSNEAEKAWEAWVGTHQDVRATHRLAFDAGRKSRDAEIAAGDELVESLRDALKYQRGLVASLDVDRDSLRQQLAEREAVIERARAAWFGPCAFDLKQHGPAVTAAIADASPSVVLAEHDARVLEEEAALMEANPLTISAAMTGRAVEYLRARAAERRKGADHGK